MPRSLSRRKASASRIAPPPRWQAYAYMLTNTLCWGAAFVAVKPALETTTPFRFLFYRFVIASLLSIPMLVHYWPKINKPWTQVRTITAHEFLGGTLALALVYEGLALTDVIEASILTSLLPLFITIGGVLLLREKQERHEWLGMGIALLGTIILILQPVFFGFTPIAKISLIGNFLILGHNLVNLFYFPLAKRAYVALPKLFVASISFITCGFSFAALSLWEAGGLAAWWQYVLIDMASADVWIASLYMATFGSIIGLTAYIKGQDMIEASEASVFTYLGFPVTLVLAHFILGERLGMDQIWLLLIIVFGVIITELRFPRADRTAAR